jgi:hypothetical protein
MVLPSSLFVPQKPIYQMFGLLEHESEDRGKRISGGKDRKKVVRKDEGTVKGRGRSAVGEIIF